MNISGVSDLWFGEGAGKGWNRVEGRWGVAGPVGRLAEGRGWVMDVAIWLDHNLHPQAGWAQSRCLDLCP